MGQPAEPGYVLSDHAQTVIREREIIEAWIAVTLSQPMRKERDSRDPAAHHAGQFMA